MATKPRNVSRHHPAQSADKAPFIDHSQANSSRPQRLFGYFSELRVKNFGTEGKISLSNKVERIGFTLNGKKFVHLYPEMLKTQGLCEKSGAIVIHLMKKGE